MRRQSTSSTGRTGTGGATGTGGTQSTGGATTGSGGAQGSGGTTGSATRPSYNTGTGFFVLNGKLYDANGKEVRILKRGVPVAEVTGARPSLMRQLRRGTQRIPP